MRRYPLYARSESVALRHSKSLESAFHKTVKVSKDISLRKISTSSDDLFLPNTMETYPATITYGVSFFSNTDVKSKTKRSMPFSSFSKFMVPDVLSIFIQ